MKRLKRIRIAGELLPGPCVYVKGYLHGKRNLIALEGDEQKTIRSAYLYKQRYAYAEYKEKVLLKKEELLKPLSQHLYDLESKKIVDEEKLRLIENKLSLVEKPVNGNEWRAKEELEKQKENQVIRVTSNNVDINEVTEKIELLNGYAEHCLQQRLARLQSKAYSYILGVQRSMKTYDYYLQVDDYAKEVYQDLLPMNV